MRLFIAVNFDEPVKNWLAAITEKLREQTVSGNFSRRENFHLTLAFLGDIKPSQVAAVKRAMDAVSPGKIDLLLRGVGRFRRDGGDIYWIGVERTPRLEQVHAALTDALRAGGFAVEDREFRPHLTLGRQIRTERGFHKEAFSASVGKKPFAAKRISLMLSERIDGRLTYTELYGKEL